MALFGAPLAHEDHARRACYAALRLRGELERYSRELKRERGFGFAVRMGLNSGEVVVGRIGDDLRMDYTAQGPTVHLAARMEQLADPGRIYLAEPVARLARGFVELDELGRFNLEGMPEPVAVYELLGAGALRSGFDLARSRGLSRFVGRGPEMATLESALARAAKGDGCAVGVVAEAGTGKSRLCFEFTEQCRVKGVRVRLAQCVSHGRMIPFIPVLELFRDLLEIDEREDDERVRDRIAGRLIRLDADLGGTLPLLFEFLGVPDPKQPAPQVDAEARQRALFGILERLLRAGTDEAPALILIEDLHWIDGGSAAFLEKLVESVAGTQTLLLVNFRPEYREAWLESSHVEVLPIDPLGEGEIRELLGDLLGDDESVRALPELIAERTRGNPFFIEEVVRSLVESGSLAGARGAYRLMSSVEELLVPDTVQAVLAARIDRLAEPAKRLLQIAGVIGEAFSESLLAAASGEPEARMAAHLRNLLETEFIFQKSLYPDPEYAFKHPLTREVAYRSLLGDQRARHHAAVARAIEELLSDALEENAALLSHHWEQAGELLGAARWARRAADFAGFADQPEAFRQWRRVRELAGCVKETEDAAELALSACVWTLRFGWRMGIGADEAHAVFEEGKSLAEDLSDRRSLASLCAAYGILNVLALSGVPDPLGPIEESMRIAREIDDPAFRLRLAPDWAVAYNARGRPIDSLRICDEAIVEAQGDPRIGDAITRFRAYSLLLCTKTAALFNLTGDVERCRELAEEAYRLAKAQRADEVLFWATEGCAQNASAAGELEEALRFVHEGVELAERIGGRLILGSAYGRLGWVLRDAGRWAEAREALERSRDCFAAGSWWQIRLPSLAEAYLHTGDPERARDAAVQALSGTGARRAHLALARILLETEGTAAGDRIEAELDSAEAMSHESGFKIDLPEIQIERARLADLLGDVGGRKRALAQARRLLLEMGLQWRIDELEREFPS